LDNDTSLNAVAFYILWFSELQKPTQQLILMEKIRGAQLLLKKKRYSNETLFFLPYKTEVTEVTEALGDVMVCKYAMITLLRFRVGAWDTCKLAVDNATLPQHDLKRKTSVRSKKYKEEVEPGLVNFFQKVVVLLSGPRPTRATADNLVR
jgi:hypothetical protein